MRFQEHADPAMLETTVLVRPSHVGICGTDLHAEALHHFLPGVVMGHEVAGHVVALGSAAQRFTVGDLVVINPNGNTFAGAATHAGVAVKNSLLERRF